jgi:hypothetical protein
MTALTSAPHAAPVFRLRSRLASLRGLVVLALSILIALTFALDVARGVQIPGSPSASATSVVEVPSQGLPGRAG